MNSSNVPSAEAYEKLNQYIDLMAKYGPDSPEASQFFDDNRQVVGFEVNARQQYALEKEDFEARLARFGRRSD